MGDPLTVFREAVAAIEAARRVIIVHPDWEDAIREAIADCKYPGMFSVSVSDRCPRDTVFMVAHADALSHRTEGES